MQQEYLQIGEIVRPQGIRGEVKLRAMTEDMSRYARLESVFLKKNGLLMVTRFTGSAVIPQNRQKAAESGMAERLTCTADVLVRNRLVPIGMEKVIPAKVKIQRGSASAGALTKR